jgi:DNA-binding transcriptional ArsR family regulator
MRPASITQSAFKAPLNGILGTEASVRILRVLASASVPLTRSEVATQAKLYSSGVPRVLSHLEDQGIVESIGQGRSRPVRLRQQHPFYNALKNLFGEEGARVARVLEGIRNALNQLSPAPAAAWIEGPVATDSDRYSDPLTVGVLADSPDSQGWNAHLRNAFNQLQRLHDVAIEAHVWWRADILAVSDSARAVLLTITPLIGPPPLDILGLSRDAAAPGTATREFSHDMHDATARQFAAAIANRIRTQPGIVDDAIKYLDRRLPAVSSNERLELQEWHDILTTYSHSRLRSFLVSDSERATRLRQSLPFVNVLSSADRESIRAATDKTEGG